MGCTQTKPIREAEGRDEFKTLNANGGECAASKFSGRPGGVIDAPPAPAAGPPAERDCGGSSAPNDCQAKAPVSNISSQEDLQRQNHMHTEQHAGVEVTISRCPFTHGSVGAGPFPGYVHGNHTAICKNGCKPDPNLGRDGRAGEDTLQTLIREALEYQDMYHMDMESAPGVKEARVQQILEEIKATGTYTHTFEELQHGARMAWRNAAKCSNRKFWSELQLLDARNVTTPADMFAVCLEVLERALHSCVTTANIAVFRPQTPGKADGPRVWNNQLLRYAGYADPDTGKPIGDPVEMDFTRMVMEDFGWSPPGGKPGRFDALPVVLQAHPDEPPQMFEVPEQYMMRVPIRHPTNDAFAALKLEWYAVPAVANIELAVGGILYTAAPFNGWYADTEIVRNLTDEGRYNLCAEVASKALGLETKSDATMWRDRAIVEIDAAVVHSFREAGMGMVDHHTLMKNFHTHYYRELDKRGFCPGNWKWILSPISPTASKCYLGLSKMTEYTIKPGYWYAPGWKKYRAALQSRGSQQPGMQHSTPDAAPTAAAAVAETAAIATAAPAAHDAKHTVVLAYATVTGNTQQFAVAVAGILSRCKPLKVLLLNMEDFEPDSWAASLQAASLVLLMCSTYGPGAPPSGSAKFFGWLAGSKDRELEAVLSGKPFSVLGFGSSSYPRFAAAADLLHSLMLAAGAKAMLSPAKADALAGEEGVVWPWLTRVAGVMQEQGWLDAAAADALAQQIPVMDANTTTTWTPEFNLMHLKGEGLHAAREKGCHYGQVLEVTELLRATEGGASTKLLRMDIGKVACGSYHAGDAVAVYGENPPDLVLRFAAYLGIVADEIDDMFMMQKIQGDPSEIGSNCDRFPLPNSFRSILSGYAGLSERLQFSALAALAPCAPEDARLQQLSGSFTLYADWNAEVVPRWGDLFELFPALIGRVPLATFFSLVPLVRPRYYSIASSAAVAPNQLAVCVSRLTYHTPNGAPREGFCSSYITERLAPGDKLRFKLVAQPAFRHPFNLSVPVVMVAAGTGLAPFKGFWDERMLRQRQQQQLGPAVLLFGCRSKETDFLLQETIDDMKQAGVLSEVLPALSRQQGVPKTYVQDLVTGSAAPLLKPLLQHPRVHVYVCGSSNMAAEVSRAFGKLMGKEAVEACIEEGRYREDVFGVLPGGYQTAARDARQQLAIKLLAGKPLADVLAHLDSDGADVNAVDEAGRTLLHYACATERVDLVTALLARKALPNPVCDYGLTPVAEAAVAGQSAAAAVLQQAGGVRVSPLHASYYPVHAAVMEGSVDKLQELLQTGANPDQRDHLMVTPLHIAAILGDVPCAEALLLAGAASSMANKLGLTPLQLAVSHHQTGMASLLRRYNATMQATHVTSAAGVGADVVLWSADSKAGLEAAFGVSPDDVARVRASWSFKSGEAFPGEVHHVLEQFGLKLFDVLFSSYPQLHSMFPFKDAEGNIAYQDLRAHGLMFAATLGEIVQRLTNVDSLDKYVTDLVVRHVRFGVQLMHYDVVLTALQALLVELGATKAPEDAEAWRRALNVIKVVAQREYSK